MEARIITNRQQWNEYVAGAEQCNVTQSYEWGQLLTTLDGEVLYVGVVNDEGKMCAAMLLLVSHVAVSNSAYFYAPRGPIIDDPDSPAMTVLLNYVKALAHKYHAFMLKIEPGVPENDPKWLSALHRRGFVANPEALHLRHEWVLDIRPDEQTILAGMKKTWRYCVRLASRKDVTVRRGESLADIDTFYRILQTTSQRDTFMIYDKSFYERLVELYGQSGNVALFIAEYEGQALGAALLVTMGRWCWYMYGASSNEHRDRMPNHLLQWTAMRWAKEQGCWYYNFRGIPDILEEGQPMWGVYVFKSGFGGYAMRSLETHDLPYNPLLYRLYRGWLDGRSWLKDVRAKRQARQLEAAKQEEKQKDDEPASAEQALKPAQAQAAVEAKPEKRAKKHPEKPVQAAEQDPSQPQNGPQASIHVPPRLPTPLTQTEAPQPSDPSGQTAHEETSIYAQSRMSNAQIDEATQARPELIEAQPGPVQREELEDQSISIATPLEAQDVGQKIETLVEHVETRDEPEAEAEVQPASIQADREAETVAEHIETGDQAEPALEARGEPFLPGVESTREHMETTEEGRASRSVVQPDTLQQIQEDPEDEDDILNEETQKLPRIQMAQKHTNARKLEE